MKKSDIIFKEEKGIVYEIFQRIGNYKRISISCS